MPAEEGEQKQVIIVGAGVVGCAMAYHLAQRAVPDILVLDPSPTDPVGSTGCVPGFVGQFNENEVLTALACESVAAYRAIPGAFDAVGGLEHAVSQKALEVLRRRHGLAKRQGLAAEMVGEGEARALAPSFMPASKVLGSLHFPSDGTADARLITKSYVAASQARGVRYETERVIGLTFDSSTNAVAGVQTASGRQISGKTVILATGIWTSALAAASGLADLVPPIVPVAHPYVHFSKTTEEMQAMTKSPFVRIPEYTIYIRDHGPTIGLGSYAHSPIPLSNREMEGHQTAVGELSATLKTCLDEAYDKLEIKPSLFENGREAAPYNGIFAVTPDNLPVVGAVQDRPGLYVCAAVWITHAAGCARLLSDLITSLEVKTDDKKLIDALRVDRFKSFNDEELRQRAVSGYNDIYHSGDRDAP